MLKKMRLQKRGTGGVDTAVQGSVYDISNTDRLGKSEVGWCWLVLVGNEVLITPVFCARLR